MTAARSLLPPLVLAIGALIAACAPGGRGPWTREPAPGAAASVAPPLYTHARQLTFAGLRSGEGYFSQDASSIVFQSEREPGNPFYQIYVMQLTTGVVQRVSPGTGKATCGWFHPGGRRVFFASTHLDPNAAAKQEDELADRAAGREKRYSWDFDENYDLFSTDLDAPTRPARRLSETRGYDAEGSLSPDGRQIVFASNRHAYGAAGPASEPEQLALDPGELVDLYVMDANGANVRRLTDSPGYDGGPFFSPDGGRIVWRRFAEGGQTAEIMSMRSDGSDVRQLTRLGAMSWAPFFHPSGDYVVFATNVHGYENFELYAVDVLGEREPVRVTDAPGFDGLPAFSPDGKQLLWTSTRTPGGESQLFLARWDDALARERLGLPAVHSAVAEPLLPVPTESVPAITETDLRAHVEALTSDASDGRLTGSPGERVATSYVARVFRALGLEPAGEAGGFFQEFGFTAGVSLGPDNRLTIESEGAAEPAPEFEVDRDWRPFAFSAEGHFEAAEIVFAGYGIVAPADEENAAVDDYADLDVSDRWVLVFRYVPERVSAETRQHLHRYASLRHKAMIARDRGARGLLVVSGPSSQVREQLAALRFDVSLAGSSIATLSITDDLARYLLAGSGRKLESLQRRADTGGDADGFVLEGVRLAADVDLEQQRSQGRNVLARLQAGRKPSADFLLVGAHVDHLGHGQGAASLATDDEKGMIHPGADDNASGVAALLELAQWLREAKRRGEVSLRRDVVFAAWSGEEIGLLGSSHYAGRLDPEPTKGDLHAANAPEATAPREVFAYLNMDMVGRLRDKLSLYGVGSSSIWKAEIERHAAPIGIPISTQNDSFLPTDATSFYARGVPVLSAFTGAHVEYHTPRDRSESLDYRGMRDVARLMAGITASLLTREEAPDYVAMQAPQSEGSARVRTYLGTVPDYAESDAHGVVLSGVVQGGPADLAGVRERDVIVELAGRKIENIYDYTYALDALRIGEEVEIVVEREGRRVPLRIVPASRE